MSHTENHASGRLGTVLRDLGSAIGDLFGGGKLDPEQAVSIDVSFGFLGLLAGADSIVTTHEAEFVNLYMDELHLSTRARDLAHEAFTRGRKREVLVDVEARRFLALFGPDSAEMERLFDALIRLSEADGRLRHSEKLVLEKITLGLGLPIAKLQARLVN